MSTKISAEYEVFRDLEHWMPAKDIVSITDIMPEEDKLFGFFAYLYAQTKSIYAHVAVRKNGEDPFVHPLNVVINLQRAGITDAITLCAGLMHDYIEEKVDIYRDSQNILEWGKGIKILDEYEERVFLELEQKLSEFAAKNGVSQRVIKDILAILTLLTRHKRDFYYQSIIGIFECRDEKIRERAIQVKLADRTHNILCIDNFTEEQRLFQCFKNLFILNNVKLYLMKRRGKKLFTGNDATEKLFKKCGKATYDAFLFICYRSLDTGIDQVTSMIQLAFKKFVLEKSGLWEVTRVNQKEKHPLRLFQGVIRTYDARLHHHWREYESMKRQELKYCQRFFKDFKFTSPQIQAIIDYKDAYSLKEVIAYLMYQPEYTLERFSYKKLFRKGK